MAQTKVKDGLLNFPDRDDFIQLPSGTTAQRPSSPVEGYFRYNTEEENIEFWNGVEWVLGGAAEVPAPTVDSLVYPNQGQTSLDPAGSETVVIRGTLFSNITNVLFGATSVNSFTVNNETTITVSSPAKIAGNFDVIIQTAENQTATLLNGVIYNGVPSWNTSPGEISVIKRNDSTYKSIQLSAAEPDGGLIQYSIVSGVLPSGLSLSNTGLITGNAVDPGSETVYNFTVRATDNEGQFTDRSFSIKLRDEITEVLTASTSWIVPTGITSIAFELAAAGGGGGGGGSGGGCGYATGGGGAQGGTGASISYKGGSGSTGGNYTGGAGGAGGGSNYESPQSLSVTPGQSLSASVGIGGAGGRGGYYKGGTESGSFGGRAGIAGSPGSQTSFAGISTSGTNYSTGQTGSAGNGQSPFFTDIINDQQENRVNYNGRHGGKGADGRIRISY